MYSFMNFPRNELTENGGSIIFSGAKLPVCLVYQVVNTGLLEMLAMCILGHI